MSTIAGPMTGTPTMPPGVGPIAAANPTPGMPPINPNVAAATMNTTREELEAKVNVKVQLHIIPANHA